MSSNIAKSEKWYKPYDPIVWILLLVAFIAIIVYQENNYRYDDTRIPFNKNITTIKEAIDETDKIVKDKYGDKYEFCRIRGNANNIHREDKIQPDLTISYLKVKGITKKRIDIDVSLEDNMVTYISTTSDSYLEKEVNFDYDVNKLDIKEILSIVESKVDMEKVKSGYEPYLNFSTYDNDMNIDVGYYKKMKNSGVDYDSRVNYNFIINIKSQQIKSESIEGQL